MHLQQQNSENPIERLRISHKLTQEGMAAKLGFGNKHQYTHHAKSFTEAIIKKVKDTYGIDITMEIIAHLKFLAKKPKTPIPAKLKTPPNTSPGYSSMSDF